MIKLPSATLEKLRCVDCRSYLSCGPIAVFPTGQASCGRCKIIQPGIVCNTYSTAAAAFIFPCKYDKCPAILSWMKVIEHEDKCSYRSSGCLCCRHPGSVAGGKNNKNGQEGAMVPYTPPMSVMDQLKCSLCNGFLAARPIYLSTPNGQNICHRCGSSLSQPTTRNVPLETVLESYMFKCSYRNYGCPEYRKFGSDSFNHEIECRFKEVCEKAHANAGEDTGGADQARLNRAREIMYHEEVGMERGYHDNNGYQNDTHYPRESGGYSKVIDQIVENTGLGQYFRDANVTNPRDNYAHENNPRGYNYDKNPRENSIYEKNTKNPVDRNDKNVDNPIETKHEGKIKRVLVTPRGPIYATVTPNNAALQLSLNTNHTPLKEAYAMPLNDGLYGLAPRPSYSRHSHDHHPIVNEAPDFDTLSERSSTHTRQHSGASGSVFGRQESIPLDRKESVLNKNVVPIYKDMVTELKFRQKGHQ